MKNKTTLILLAISISLLSFSCSKNEKKDSSQVAIQTNKEPESKSYPIKGEEIYLREGPGKNFTSVNDAIYNTNANDYEPSFNTPFASTFSDYKRFDFSVNKLIALKKSYIIAFASINNIFNNKNQSSVYYNENYTQESFNYFQQRTLYFGMQLRF